MPFKLIVATDEDNGIGKNNSIPWRCKEDLRFFSKTTRGNNNNAIIMGRKTWDSLGNKPLPMRDNYILSRSFLTNVEYETAFAYTNINKLIHICCKKNYDDVWIIGGAEIYNLFLQTNIVSELYITKIKGNYNCDTFFNFDTTIFSLCSDNNTLTNADNSTTPSASYQIWKNITQ